MGTLMFSTTREVPRPVLMSQGSLSPAGPVEVTSFLDALEAWCVWGASETGAGFTTPEEAPILSFPCAEPSCKAKNPFIVQEPPQCVCVVCVDFGM